MEVNPILREYDQKRTTLIEFGKRMEFAIQQSVAGANIKTQSIEHRIKERRSLDAKLSRPDVRYSQLNDVTDVCGLRIITYFAEDVDKVASLLQSEFQVDSSLSIDKRVYDDPDRFGYKSLHYIVSLRAERISLPEYSTFEGYLAEVQVRTVIQHAWAEIEHDLGYKSELAVPKDVKRRLFRLAAMLEIADEEFGGINNTLIRYRNEVGEQLKRDLASITIDSTSIAEFVKTDTLVTQIDHELSKRSGKAIVPMPDRGAAATATWLNSVGFSSIKEVRDALQIYSDAILRVAPPRISASAIRSVGAGIGLLYLCYAVLSNADQAIEKLIAFLDQNSFSHQEGSNESFARIIHSAFKQAAAGNAGSPSAASSG